MSPGRIALALAIGAGLTGACGDDVVGVGSCLTSPLTTESGLRVEDLDCGQGRVARAGDIVSVRYAAAIDGRTVEERRRFRFALGREQVIAGWDEGIAGMREGGTRRLLVPPELAFGESGLGARVPPSATIEFEVDLLDVSSRD